MRSLRLLTYVTALISTSATAATLQTLTGNLDTDIKGISILFNASPTPAGTNLVITAPFETAEEGDTISGVINSLGFASQQTQFSGGIYVVTLTLAAAPPSPVTLNLTGADTFQGQALVNLLATFAYIGAGTCGSDCGDVLGEFGSLPGFDACVNGFGGVSTCSVTAPLALTGNFISSSSGTGVTGLMNVSVEAVTIPEPASVLLTAMGIAALAFARRSRK